MRYLLSWHIHESEMHARPPEWREEVAAFLTKFEDNLFGNSELDWVEVLAPGRQAVLVGPGPVTRDGFYNEGGKPSSRLWAIRVASRERATEIAAELAGELDTWIEVRELRPGAQRP